MKGALSRRVSLLIAAISTLWLGPAHASGSIEWSVENNFQLISDPQARAWITELAMLSKDPEHHTLTINEVQEKWSRVPITKYNKNAGVYSPGYTHPYQWRVALGLTGAGKTERCDWRIKGTITRNQTCTDFHPGVWLGEGSHPVWVKDSNGRTTRTRIEIKDKLFVALGDSWISGEGQPDVMRDKRRGREADWWDSKCHRSLYAWPVLTAARYAAEHPQESVTLISRACSGAKIDELMNKTSNGGPLEANRKAYFSKTLPPQIRQVKRDLCILGWDKTTGQCEGSSERMPDAIFLSIGGNDAGFAGIIVDSMLKRVNRGIELKEKPIEMVLNAITKLEEGYINLDKALQADFPSSVVLMALYPDPLHLDPYSFCGRISSKDRDRVDFLSKGKLGIISRLLGRHITNKEVVAIWDNYYTRIVGRDQSADNPEDSQKACNKKRELDHKYRGLKSIGKRLMQEQPHRWFLVETSKQYKCGKSPKDNEQKPERDTDQLPDYQTKGYCSPGNDVRGKWFINADDSFEYIGNPFGAMHPNIFGQIYYASRAYQALLQLQPFAAESSQPPSSPLR